MTDKEHQASNMPEQSPPDKTLSPYLCCKGAARAIEFYKTALGAIELLRIDQPDGRVGHAEMRIGNAVIMLADEFPEIGFRSPETLGGTPVMLHLYVDDVDAFFARAIAGGAKVKQPLSDQHGDRNAQVMDPFGHQWMLATRLKQTP